MVPPLTFVALWFRWEWEDDAIIWSIGLLMFCAAIVLRVWSQKKLRYRLPGNRELATSGPYAHLRNPVYIGNLGIFASLCLLCELPWAVPPVCMWAALVYHWSVRFEEVRLLRRYGDAYAEYCKFVPRWNPSVHGLTGQTRAVPDDWRGAFRVEWHCLLLLLIPAAKECFACFVVGGS